MNKGPISKICLFMFAFFMMNIFVPISPKIVLSYAADEVSHNATSGVDELDDFDEYDEEELETIQDPFEGFNRAMFTFNDKVYFWALKPVAKAYKKVVPQLARRGIRNFFDNLNYPMRFFGAITQLKVKKAVMETFKFLTNSTLGMGGFIDYSSVFPEFEISEEDTGQTLGYYGIGHGPYIVWPLLGPMSLRDSFGFSLDYFLQPVSYVEPFYLSFGIRSYDVMNRTSLKLGEYETIKESSLDPYIAIRDAYIQHRAEQIKK